MNSKPAPGSPMTRGNMREVGAHHPIAYCHNDSCRYQAPIDVSRWDD